MKNLRHKLILLLAIVLAVLYFSSDFALLDIEDTAIVVAIGIDGTEDGVEVTAQIGVPQATQQVSQNNDTVITTKGRTVMDAISKLGSNTGWHPKMSFCNLILIGRDLATDDLTSMIDNLIADEQIQNSSMVAICDSSAKEVLTAVTPLDSISSFAIQKILLKNDQSLSTVADVNLKDFSADLHGRGNFAFMPIIYEIKGTTEGDTEGGSGGTTADSFTDDYGLVACKNSEICANNRPIGRLSSDSSSGGGQSKKTVIFNATRTAIFQDGKMIGEMTPDETIAFNLLRLKAERVLLPAGEGKDAVMLEVYKSSHMVSVEYKVKPTLKLKLRLSVRLADGADAYNEEGGGRRASVEQKYLDLLRSNLEGTVKELTESNLNSGVDIFDIRDMTYQSYHRMYEDYKKIPLSTFVVDVDVKVVSQD